MSVTKIPLMPEEVDAMRAQMAAHTTDTHGGLCPICEVETCDSWQEAAAALWWNNLDDRYEPHAADESKLLKLGIYTTPQVPPSLKAPLTPAEIQALCQELARHAVTDTGWCTHCSANWCPPWMQAASCLQLNGLDTAFLTYIKACQTT